jgi:AraC-like DNA-binding protein
MRISLYFLFFFVINSAFSQSNFTLTEQEYQKLHDRARFLINSNVDSSFIYANKIEHSNSKLHKSFAYGIKSYLYQLKGNSIKSKQLYKQAFAYLDKIPASNDKTKLNAYLLNYGGLAEWKRGSLSNALELYLKGKKLSVQAKDIVQVIKFNTNISLINGDIGNYELAIRASKESDLLIDRYQNLYSTEQYENNKSNNYLSLGNFYSNYYWLDVAKKTRLDSASFFFKKTMIYSKNLIDNKINAQIGISGIYQLQKKNILAEKSYMNLLFNTKTNKLDQQYYLTCYNFGRFYFQQKKYDKALIYFNKVDSINSKDNFNVFINSNYYLSKIFEIKNDPENAIKYSKIYLDNFEKSEFKMISESTEINSNFEKLNLKKEMISTQKKFKKEVLFKKWLIVFFLVLFLVLIAFLVKNILEKNRVKRNVNDLIKEFSIKIDEKERLLGSFTSANNIKENIIIEEQPKKQSVIISIDEAKEIQIMNMLKVLEEKKFYLKPEFNQQEVAKKLKTNTTYLSYVVNKNFQKTFSEYSNELKINYAINEMITNATYRKYSTQAIAESVGFKNAISFTKSFNKRTGLTPVQFIKELDKH